MVLFEYTSSTQKTNWSRTDGLNANTSQAVMICVAAKRRIGLLKLALIGAQFIVVINANLEPNLAPCGEEKSTALQILTLASHRFNYFPVRTGT